VKTIIIAFSIAAFAVAVPTGSALSSTSQQHRMSWKHHAHWSSQAVQARSVRPTYPDAFGYAPDRFRASDREIETSRQAGGGGGGGGGGSGM
jgi:hypothetical protein